MKKQIQTNNKINLKPSGVDYKKVPSYLVTLSEVLYDETGERLKTKDVESLPKHKNKKNYLLIQANTWLGAMVDTTVTENYVSMVRYNALCGSAYSVERWKEHCQSGKKLVTELTKNSSDEETCKFERELRIYSDGRAVVVYKATGRDGVSVVFVPNEIFYRLKAPSGPSMYSSDSLLIAGGLKPTNTAAQIKKELEKLCLSKRYSYYHIHRKGDNEQTGEVIIPDAFKVVHSDEEIKENAVKINQTYSPIRFMFPDTYFWNVSDTKQFKYPLMTTHYQHRFCEADKEKIEQFFRFNDKQNEDKREAYGKLKDKTSSYWALDRDSLKGIGELAIYLAAIPNNSQQKKLDNCKELWKTLHFSETNHQSIWERRGALVILTFTETVHSYWYPEAKITNKYAYIYNTNTKKRTFLKKAGDEEVICPIPRLTTLCETFVVEGGRTYVSGYGYRDIVAPKPIFWDGVSMEDLFANTNVRWIIENIDNFDEYALCKADEGKLVKLKDMISEESIGKIVVGIIATSGDALLEQLLKNKLFNIYFAELWDKMNGREGRHIMEKNGYTRYGASPLEYDKKQTSLKKMFGMTVEQLRVMNDTIGLSENSWEVFTEFPGIKGMTYFFNVKEYSQIDIKTFKQAVEVAKDNTRRSRYDSPFEIVSNYQRIFNQVMENMTPKQKIALIGKYSSALESYKDYLQMREQMETLQQMRPNERIFTEDDYPLKPQKSRKFIRFRQCEEWTQGYYTTRMIRNVDDFKEMLGYKYSAEVLKTAVDCYEDGVFSGCIVELNEVDNMKIMHDEMARWISLYENEIENEKFKKALERVKDLEYTDKETGLSIIAPEDASSIRKEGSILQHCVASYVTPICNGTENIMFIRRTDMLSEPYFTLDLSIEGKIRQVHCHRNGDPTPEGIMQAYRDSGRVVYEKQFDIQKFLNNWTKAMKGKVDTKSINTRYGALCAQR